ncbi:MAG: hypothetical protein V9F05_09710 [Chitinophagaceae bacterium]
MKASTDLFDLVKSMSRSEILSFKIACGADNQIYLQLFEAICEQTAYNEIALKKLLYKELKTAKFAVLKKYLFDRLDKFLSARYDEQDAYFIMIKHFKMAQIYYDRQLLDLCKKELHKAEILAESNHCYAEQLLIYKLKEKLIRGLQTPADYETLHNEFILKESETFNLYSNLSHFKHLDSEFVVALNKLNAISSDVALNEIKKIWDHPLLSDENQAQSLLSKYFYYTIKASCANLLGKVDEGLIYREKCVELLANNAFDGADYNRFYIVATHNYLKNLRTLQLWDKFQVAFTKMEHFTKLNYDKIDQRSRMFLFTIIIFNKPDEIILSGNNSDFKTYLKFFESEMKIHIENLDPSYVAFLHVSVIYNCIRFAMPEKALDLINRMSALGLDKRLDKLYNKVFRLFVLMVHFELKNYRLLRNLAEAHMRYLQRNGKPTRFEKCLTRFFQGISFDKDELLRLQHELIEIHNYKEEKFQFEYIQILSWIEHHITGQPFATILRKQQLGN